MRSEKKKFLVPLLVTVCCYAIGAGPIFGQEACSAAFVANNSEELPSGFDVSEALNWKELLEESLNCEIQPSTWVSDGSPLFQMGEASAIGSFSGIFYDSTLGEAVAAFQLNSMFDPSMPSQNQVAILSMDELRNFGESWMSSIDAEINVLPQDIAFSGVRYLPYEAVGEEVEGVLANSIAASLVLSHTQRFSFSSNPTGATVFVGDDTFQTVRIRAYARNSIDEVRMSLDGYEDCMLTTEDFRDDWVNSQMIVHCDFPTD
jgi:hypothetical protein